MLNTVVSFLDTLLPDLRREGFCLYPDETHRITLMEKEGGPVFVYDAFVAGMWYPMGSVEVPLSRSFWAGVVRVVRLYTGRVFPVADEMVAAMVVVGLPGADLLTQERVVETVVLPRRAGAKNPDFIGTVKSRGKTSRKNKEEDNEKDVIDPD